MSGRQTQFLSADQIQRAVEVMRAYLAARGDPHVRTPVEVQTERDQRRVTVIEGELLPLLQHYLSAGIGVVEFKTRIDGVNKRSDLWGFRGVKGQMFFNMVVNVAGDQVECDREMKAAIKAPASEGAASNQIKTFSDYVKGIGDQHLRSGGTKWGRPKPGSVPFFLSYFWQVQERGVWPIFYTNTVNTMTDMNLWQPTGEPGADYITYKRIHEELARVFAQESERPFGLYEVEHVFWFWGGRDAGAPYTGDKPRARDDTRGATGAGIRLPESYVPPIVGILPQMARNDTWLREAAKASGTSLERAFEKSINAAFTVLGYETKLLGQGQGRLPDGQAASPDDSYAILWDAKVRADCYSMGTGDRAVKEYITTQTRELARRWRPRNVYYLIVSSKFAGDFDGAIRSLKMETGVSEVCLVEADALVAMVETKMRSPREVSLGPDGLQRLFSVSGALSADMVRENLV